MIVTVYRSGVIFYVGFNFVHGKYEILMSVSQFAFRWLYSYVNPYIT